MYRVLHIDTERSWRGGQNQTKLLIEGMLAKGWRPYLAAPADSPLVHHMRGKIPILTFKTLNLVTASSEILKYVRSELIDVMDAHSARAHNLALIAKYRGTRIPLVVHRRVDYAPRMHPINMLKYRSKHVNHYVAISAAIARILEGISIAPSKLSVIHSAASYFETQHTSRHDAKLRMQALFPQLDPGQTWIGNASALSAQKDYPNLLRALKRLQDKNIAYCAVIAGSGPEEARLKKLAEDLGLQQLHFLGFLTNVSELLEALDILAVSSQDEGLGTILLDGLQAGCAVAATSVGGIPEIIEHGKTGLLSERHDDDRLAANLIQFIESPSLRALLNDQGRRKVSREFSVQSMVDGNLAVYQRVLKEFSSDR